MAFSGAKTDSHPNAPENNPEMYGFRWQIDTYIDSIGNGSADEDALYIIWIGGNDLLNITDPASAGSVILNAVTNISLGINALAGAGAKNFLIINMPDLGKTPLMNGENTEFGDPFADDPLMGYQEKVVSFEDTPEEVLNVDEQEPPPVRTEPRPSEEASYTKTTILTVGGLALLTLICGLIIWVRTRRRVSKHESFKESKNPMH